MIGGCQLPKSLRADISPGPGGTPAVLRRKHGFTCTFGDDAQRVQLALRYQIQRRARDHDPTFGGAFHNASGDVDVDTEPVRGRSAAAGRCGCRPASAACSRPPRPIFSAFSAASTARRATVGLRNTAMMPVAHPLDDVPAGVEQRRLDGPRHLAQQREGRVVAGLQRPRREADQVGEDQRHLGIRRPPRQPPRSAPATPAARSRLTSRDAASRSPSSRSAARAAARGPPSPAVDSGSPKSGSPGQQPSRPPDERHHARAVIRGRASQCAALFRPDAVRGRVERRVATGVTDSGSVSKDSPGSGSRGASSTWPGYVGSAEPGNDARRLCRSSRQTADHAVGTPGWNLDNSVAAARAEIVDNVRCQKLS